MDHIYLVTINQGTVMAFDQRENAQELVDILKKVYFIGDQVNVHVDEVPYYNSALHSPWGATFRPKDRNETTDILLSQETRDSSNADFPSHLPGKEDCGF